MAGTGVFAEILDGEVYRYYADGEWRKSASGKSVNIVNPTTRKTQYKVQGIYFASPHHYQRQKLSVWSYDVTIWKLTVPSYFLDDALRKRLE